jgi:cytochrome c oxidase cbb3-type subunit 4
MDINILREGILVLAVVAFAGIVWWAYGPSRRGRFEQAALSVLEDDDSDAELRTGARHGVDARKG